MISLNSLLIMRAKCFTVYCYIDANFRESEKQVNICGKQSFQIVLNRAMWTEK